MITAALCDATDGRNLATCCRALHAHCTTTHDAAAVLDKMAAVLAQRRAVTARALLPARDSLRAARAVHTELQKLGAAQALPGRLPALRRAPTPCRGVDDRQLAAAGGQALIVRLTSLLEAPPPDMDAEAVVTARRLAGAVLLAIEGGAAHSWPRALRALRVLARRRRGVGTLAGCLEVELSTETVVEGAVGKQQQQLPQQEQRRRHATLQSALAGVDAAHCLAVSPHAVTIFRWLHAVHDLRTINTLNTWCGLPRLGDLAAREAHLSRMVRVARRADLVAMKRRMQ